MSWRIEELSPGGLADYLAFFDQRAFADNPDWADCFCMAYLVESGEWVERGGAENRASVSGSIESGASKGVLAYDGDRVCGWSRYGSRAGFPPLARRHSFDGEDGSVASIVCFVVDPAYRRRGLATALLQAACQSAAATGFRFAEGYPRLVQDTDAESYEGPLAMFIAAGFEVVDTPARGFVVRRSLTE